MSDAIPIKFATQTVVACEVCGRSGDVPWYCKNCPGSLCDTCKAAHMGTAISSRHSVVPRTGEVLRLHGPAKITEPCSIHTTKDISTYCNECQVPCCVTCLEEFHKKHDFCSIEIAYLSAERRLNDYIKKLNDEVKPKLDDKVRQSKYESDVIIQVAERVKDDIHAFRKELKDAVDSACDSIIEKVEKPGFDSREIVRKVENEKEGVNVLVSHVSEMIREGKFDIIKYTPPDLASLVPNVTMPQTENRVFVPKRDIMIQFKSNLGK